MSNAIERRSFLQAAMAAIPIVGLGGADVVEAQAPPARAEAVQAGKDRFGTPQEMGMTTMTVKVATADTGGALFALEQANRAKGGPARHLHHGQDEWFYVLDGEFVIEVGADRMNLKPGESLLAPREIPHVWAFVGAGTGRLLVAFTPAGKMEAFFREINKANAMPPQDPALWRAYGMELVGPPLSVG
jgi:quercetin dioxygenase-like cupin family protein